MKCVFRQLAGTVKTELRASGGTAFSPWFLLRPRDGKVWGRVHKCQLRVVIYLCNSFVNSSLGSSYRPWMQWRAIYKSRRTRSSIVS